MSRAARGVWLLTWLGLPFIAVFVCFFLVFGALYVWWREDVMFSRRRRKDIHAPDLPNVGA